MMEVSLSNILFIASGISIASGGAYYWIKDRKEKYSFKIYGTATIVGIVMTIINFINL